MDILDTFRSDVRNSGRILARMHEVAAASGVAPNTLRNLLYGATTNPRYNTVERLRAFYARGAV